MLESQDCSNKVDLAHYKVDWLIALVLRLGGLIEHSLLPFLLEAQQILKAAIEMHFEMQDEIFAYGILHHRIRHIALCIRHIASPDTAYCTLHTTYCISAYDILLSDTAYCITGYGILLSDTAYCISAYGILYLCIRHIALPDTALHLCIRHIAYSDTTLRHVNFVHNPPP